MGEGGDGLGVTEGIVALEREKLGLWVAVSGLWDGVRVDVGERVRDRVWVAPGLTVIDADVDGDQDRVPDPLWFPVLVELNELVLVRDREVWDPDTPEGVQLGVRVVVRVPFRLGVAVAEAERAEGVSVGVAVPLADGVSVRD